MPRDADLWVFGARNGLKFEGNAKWLFLYVAQNVPEVTPVWIARRRGIVDELRNAGFEAHLAWEARGVRRQLRAAVFVFMLNSPDINYWTSRGAFKANLQHGTPYKRFGRDVIDPDNPLYANHAGNLLERLAIRFGSPSTHQRADFTCSLSPGCSEIWARATGIPRACVEETGNPRNDVLLAPVYVPQSWDRDWYAGFEALRAEGVRVIGYLPTFRVGAAAERPSPIDWERLDRFLVERRLHLWVRWHPGDTREHRDTDGLSAIDRVPEEIDFDPLLRITDVLITDYSSAYFDYLALDRPIVFFAYDREEFLADGRALYEPYESTACGPIVGSFEELLDVLARGEEAPEERRMRSILRARYHAHTDARSCERVYRAIRRRLEA